LAPQTRYTLQRNTASNYYRRNRTRNYSTYRIRITQPTAILSAINSFSEECTHRRMKQGGRGRWPLMSEIYRALNLSI